METQMRSLGHAYIALLADHNQQSGGKATSGTQTASKKPAPKTKKRDSSQAKQKTQALPSKHTRRQLASHQTCLYTGTHHLIRHVAFFIQQGSFPLCLLFLIEVECRGAYLCRHVMNTGPFVMCSVCHLYVPHSMYRCCLTLLPFKVVGSSLIQLTFLYIQAPYELKRCFLWMFRFS